MIPYRKEMLTLAPLVKKILLQITETQDKIFSLKISFTAGHLLLHPKRISTEYCMSAQSLVRTRIRVVVALPHSINMVTF